MNRHRSAVAVLIRHRLIRKRWNPDLFQGFISVSYTHLITNRVSEIAAKEHTAKKKSKAKKYDEVDMAQMSLFDTVKDDDVLDELKNIDVGNLTPIDALNTIYRLQNKLKNRW